jgi:hypothetical protein
MGAEKAKKTRALNKQYPRICSEHCICFPPVFRARFAPEMLELAAAAEPGEWPPIFGDTSISIIRYWIAGTDSTAVLAQPSAYLSLGGSPVRPFGLLQGFVLSIAIIAGLSYAGYRWPPACPSDNHMLTHIVGPPQAKAPTAKPRQRTRERSSPQ